MMYKIIFIFSLFLFVGSCNDTPPAENAPEKKEIKKPDKMQPKSLHGKKLVPAEEKAVSLEKREVRHTNTMKDATGKTIDMTPERASKQGTSLGTAYCKCLKKQKDKIRCNGIPVGVDNFGKRYGKEIGDAAMEAFKAETKGCK